uniref:thyroid receptor-interacting protein 11-like n=1 Tax=Styela clava TaxID=7725 RepID=UPI0019399C92|nr:thyroid receptor-interacting protein 11-like [Styela clava]
MSWLGGLNDSFNQISSFTGQLGGQLSNFTKEVLTEDADNEIDYGVEAKKLEDQQKQNAVLIQNLKQENIDLKQKVHTAELHISTSGIEYEARLEKKTKEINELKRKLSDHTGLRTHDIGVAGNPLFSSSFSNVSLNDEDEEFHEIINYQREIGKLSQELEETKNELQKWKEKAENAKSATLAKSFDGQNTDALALLQSRIRELEDALRRESVHHQQEIRSIQDANNATISKYQEEIRTLKRSRSDLPASHDAVDLDKEVPFNNRQEVENLTSELNLLKEQMRTRNRQLQIQKTQIQELTTSQKEKEIELIEVKETETLFRKENEEMKNEIAELTSKCKEMEQNFDDVKSGLSEFITKANIQVLFDVENLPESIKNISESYCHLEEERTLVLTQNDEQHAEIEKLNNKVAELETLLRENVQESEAEEDNYDIELAESDQWHKEGLNQVAEEDQNVEQQTDDVESDQHQRRNNQRLPHHLNFGSPISHSSPQVVSHSRRRLREENQFSTPTTDPGDLTLTLQALKKQVEDYELEIVQYEQVQSEWQAEKKSLQELLSRYQSDPEGQSLNEPQDERAVTLEKLKQELNELQEARCALEKETNRLQQEKEQLQVATKNLEEELNESISETQTQKDQTDSLRHQLDKFENEKEKLQAAYDVLTQELNKSREEKNDLNEALDALDTQHQDEMAQLLTVRDDLKEQLKSTKFQLEEEKVSGEKLSNDLDNTKMQLADVSQSNNECSQENDDEISSLNLKLSKLESEKNDIELKLKNYVISMEKLQNENEKKLSVIEELKQTLNKVEKEKQFFDEKHTQLEEDMRQKDGELADVRVKLQELERHHENMNQSHLQLEKALQVKEGLLEDTQVEKNETEKCSSSEISRLHEEIESLGTELENAGREMAEFQSSHMEEKKKILKDNQDLIKNIEDGFQVKLKALYDEQEVFKKEAAATEKVYKDKIEHLEKINFNLQKQMEKNENEAFQQSATISHDNDELIQNLQSKHSNITDQYNALLDDHNALISSFQTERASLENRFKLETDGKIQLQKECSELKNLLQKAKDSETGLLSELSTLRVELEQAKQKIDFLSENENVLVKKNNDIDSDQAENSALQTLREEYEKKLNRQLTEIDNLKMRLSLESQHPSARPEMNLEKLLNSIDGQDIAGLEKSDLSKDDIGLLLQLVKERDEVISMLTQRRSEEDSNTMASVAEIRRLEDENRALTADKDQILAVISEKTKENKKLKDEAHKMMGIVAESNAALQKVQQENMALLAKYEGYDREMTKEAVGKLSRLVTEKELEIESLKQKCGTLLEVLQQQPTTGGSVPDKNAVSGQQVQNLIRDKETLTGQVQQLLTERNHLVALLNQRQVEVEQVRGEVVKASEALKHDSDNNSKLQIDYGNLVHDYEQTQMKLSSMQRDLFPLREKMIELENIKQALLKKLDDDTAVKLVSEDFQMSSRDKNEDRSATNNSSQGYTATSSSEMRNLKESLKQKQDLVDQVTQESTKKSIEIEKLINDSKEKDLLIHSLTEAKTRSEKDLMAKLNEVEILRKSVENLREQVAGLSKNCEEARLEVRDYSSRLSEKDAESRAFQETNGQLSMLLKEKEYEVENAREKCKRLQEMAQQNRQGEETESQKLLVELDSAKQMLIAARHERDQVMLSLKQRKLESDKYSEEARALREKETKLESELSRLRNHLIQVEEVYTQEAMLAEERENNLKEQLQQTRSTNMATREASEQTQQQAESLQEQLRTAIAQRDQAIQQLQLTQEQGMQYASALQKLQVAVERMQREDAANFAEQLDKVKLQLESRNNDANAFETLANELKMKLENANEALKSASRLNQQLELKEENISQLKNMVGEKQLHIDELQDRLHDIASKNESMVDKEIVKNLIIGYFTSPNNKRPDVLRLITAVLRFSQQDVERMNAGAPPEGARGWIGSWFRQGGSQQARPSMSLPASPRSGSTNETFTQMFVKFLETESVPHQAAKLPTTAMINEAQQKTNLRRPPRSPVLSSVPTPIGTVAAERAGPVVAGRYSPFLLSTSGAVTPHRGQGSTTSHPVVLHPVTPILPTFTPIINPKSSAEQEILQDILLSKNDR